MSIFEDFMIAQAGKLHDRNVELLKALKAIVALDPENTAEGFNEWGEAQSFRDAQQIAKDAIAKADTQ